MRFIEKSFGSFHEFRKTFTDSALAQFSSGWVWLAQDGDLLKVVKTSHADVPVARGQRALPTRDLWEQAHYLDHQNRLQDFVRASLNHLAH